MRPIGKNLLDIIGNTPLLALEQYSLTSDLQTPLLAKLEFFNPAGSVKDRIAKAMIETAEEQGLLQKNSIIIEPTSGNTGIGLAAVASAKGYRTILIMPETMSMERRALLAAYGAQLILTDGTKGMSGAIAKARELAAATPNSFLPSQFDNPANPKAHEKTTGPEIWEDTQGSVDMFVAGVGTGGTITGVGTFLKSKNSTIKIVAVEPATSQVLAGKNPGSHGIQGIGAGFIPSIMNLDLVDEIIPVTEVEAYAASRLVNRTEGLLVGISSGAALHAATVLAKRAENQRKQIVVLFPDGGERYLSTPLFE